MNCTKDPGDSSSVTLNVSYLPKQTTVFAGLSEAIRREIYSAVVHGGDRASREAELKYPTNPSNIPMDKLRNYDWQGVSTKNTEEATRLTKIFEQELLQKYKISAAQLKAIKDEGLMEQWPFPPRQ